jgi:hypothetical protein
MPHIITCPTVLTGSIRGLEVREERFLAERNLAKTGSVVDELLRACWEENHDAGPYDFGGKTIDGDKVRGTSRPRRQCRSSATHETSERGTFSSALRGTMSRSNVTAGTPYGTAALISTTMSSTPASANPNSIACVSSAIDAAHCAVSRRHREACPGAFLRCAIECVSSR